MDSNFIERTLPYEIENLRCYMVEKPENTVCKYLWGPDGTGKSLLVRSWLSKWDDTRQKENHIYYFYMDLKEIENTHKKGYWEIWKKLCSSFETVIPKEDYAKKEDDVTAAYKQMQFSVEEIAGNYAENARYRMDNLFEVFTELGIHIKVIMDNFEEVVRIFPEDTDDGKIFERLFGLSPKGALKKINLSILLISDRCIEETVHHMDGGSTFESAYNPICLSNFTEADMDNYYAILKEAFGEITELQKEKIDYYCGKHPEMLMIMYDMLTKSGKDAGYDIDKLYDESGKALKEYYEGFYQKLEEMDLVDFWADILVEGDSQEKEWSSETLYDCGFLYKEMYEDTYFKLSEGLGDYISGKMN